MLVRPTYRQVLKTARNMRDLDRREATALMSADPSEVAFEVCNYGTPYWGAMIGGDVPAYVFGLYVMPHNCEWAVWGFGTHNFPKVIRNVSKFIVRDVVPKLRQCGIERIEVMSLAEKTDAHRWLEWLGFKPFGDVQDYRGTGENFKRFEWR